MSLVYGHNTFLISRFSAAELGLNPLDYPNICFEHRQKYGHLYWIPFISMGNVYVISKGDKYLHCTSDVERLLKQKSPPKTSIFAFTGFLLIGLGLIIYFLNEFQQNKSINNSIKKQENQHVTYLTNCVNNYQAHYYFGFRKYAIDASNFTDEEIIATVLTNTDSSLLLGFYEKIKEQDIAMASKEPIETSENAITRKPDLPEYINRGKIMDSVWVQKANVIATLDVLNKSTASSLENGLKFGTNKYIFKLNKVYKMLGPKPRVSTKLEAQERNYFELTNYGLNATADSIIGRNPNTKWLLSNVRAFNYKDKIAIKTTDTGYATLYFSNKAKQVFAFEIYYNYREMQSVSITKLDTTDGSQNMDALEPWHYDYDVD